MSKFPLCIYVIYLKNVKDSISLCYRISFHLTTLVIITKKIYCTCLSSFVWLISEQTLLHVLIMVYRQYSVYL